MARRVASSAARLMDGPSAVTPKSLASGTPAPDSLQREVWTDEISDTKRVVTRLEEPMDVFTVFEAVGLWAGLKAMRLAWDPYLRRIAVASAVPSAPGPLR